MGRRGTDASENGEFDLPVAAGARIGGVAPQPDLASALGGSDLDLEVQPATALADADKADRSVRLDLVEQGLPLRRRPRLEPRFRQTPRDPGVTLGVVAVQRRHEVVGGALRLSGGQGGRNWRRGRGLSREGDEKTRVRFTITVEPSAPLPEFLVNRARKKILDAATEGLRRRVMGSAG